MVDTTAHSNVLVGADYDITSMAHSNEHIPWLGRETQEHIH